jgi:nucleoside-diphosphate-sugar epimerase
MVVVGNGMLARAFGRFASDDSVVVFASGVSDSGQTRAAEFEREAALLRSFAGSPRKLVYFSTISVLDPSLEASPYIGHKLAMEALVVAALPRHVVFRLPNLVGHTPNPHTLTNHLFDRIMRGETVRVFTRARRHLLDVEDAATLCSRMITDGVADNQVTNVHLGRPIDIPTLVSIFERVTGRRARTELVDKGDASTAENTQFARFIASIGFTVPDDYNERVIEHYYLERGAERR